MSMQPGPELDRLVAEKVMGWHLVEESDTDSSFDWWSDGHGADRIKYCTTSVSIGYHGGGWQVWSPSTNIAHAWEVVKKVTQMKRDGRELCVSLYAYKDRCGCLIDLGAHPHGLDDPVELADVEAPTAPLAICLAALCAVGFNA